MDTHDGIRRIGKLAFYNCISLRQMNLKSAVNIGYEAFCKCVNLEYVEFGDMLETIGYAAFNRCTSLPHLKLTSITTIEACAFDGCNRLTDVELSERLETIGRSAFRNCERLQRIAIPMKRGLFEFSDFHQRYNQFEDCVQLVEVDLVGQAHTQIVASLHMESWRSEMISEINRINQVLSNTPDREKAEEIRQWMELVLDKMDHYKAEHCRYVKEGTALLELALWKAKLCEKEDNSVEGRAKKAKVDAESVRKERRITCGADMVIKNVLPFLKLN